MRLLAAAPAEAVPVPAPAEHIGRVAASAAHELDSVGVAGAGAPLDPPAALLHVRPEREPRLALP